MSSTKGLLKLIESVHIELRDLFTDRDLIAREIELKKAKLEALEEALKTVEISEKRSGDGERRMRMGVKKRLIYQLVDYGLDSLNNIEKFLPEQFNPRYARAVVRDALEDGDMSGDLDANFELTALGDELLAKAPLPKGWDQYANIVDAAQDFRASMFDR